MELIGSAANATTMMRGEILANTGVRMRSAGRSQVTSWMSKRDMSYFAAITTGEWHLKTWGQLPGRR